MLQLFRWPESLFRLFEWCKIDWHYRSTKDAEVTTAEMKASNDFEIKELQYMCVASPAPPPPSMFDCFFYPFFFWRGGLLFRC